MSRYLHILHLEDNPYDAELIRETLMAEGLEHTIVNVDDRPGFLQAIEQYQFDLIIADFALPSFSGQAALIIAQTKCPEVPFLFVSGAIGEEQAIESLKQGATDYVLKHRLSRLYPAIHRALREVEERRQHQQAVASLAIRARQQAAVAQLGQLALINTHLPQLMDEAATLVAQALEVEYSQLLQCQDNSTALHLVAGEGWPEGVVGQAIINADLNSQAGYTLLSHEPVIVADLASETRFLPSPLALEHQIISGMSVVVAGREQPFGVLGAFTTHHRSFTEDDINFLQSIAHVLATAIERQQREEQLRLSRNQLRAILHGITEGITVQRPDGSIIYVNEIGAQLSGYSSVQAYLNAPATEISQRFTLRNEAGDPFPLNQLPATLALQGQASTDVLIRFQPVAGGEERWSVVSAMPIFNEQEQVQFAVNILRDVTERTLLYEREKEARQQAEAVAIRIASLQIVSAALTEALTPIQVAQVIEEQTVAVVGAQAAATFMLHHTPSGPMLVLLHSIGYREEQVAPLRQFALDAPFPVAETVRTGQPVFLASRTEAQEKFPAFIAHRTSAHHAWAVLPLMIEGRVIGAIGLGFKHEQQFGAEDQAFLFSLARQCTQALERARLYEAERQARQLAEEAAERTAGLQRVTAALSQALTPSQVAQFVVEQGVSVLGAQAGSVVVTTDKDVTLDLLYAGGYNTEVATRWRHFPLTTPLPIAEVIRTGQPIFLSSPEEALRQYPLVRQDIMLTGNQAWATIPLRIEGRTIGALGLSFAEARLFDENDETFMLALGRQCAQALERARLYEAERIARAEAEIARHRLGFLAEASDILATSHDFHWTLNKVAHLAVPQIADWCGVILLREEKSIPVIEAIAVVHKDPEKIAWATRLLQTYAPKPENTLGLPTVLKQGQSLLYPDFSHTLLAFRDTPATRDILHFSDVRSVMMVPLKARERIMGAMLFATAESERLFDQDDLTLAEDLARRAALAVDNARLYWEATRLNEKLEQRVAERTEQLRRLTQQVVSTQEEERRRLSRELHDEAGQALTALKISLGLIQEDLPDELPLLKQRMGEAVALTREAMDQIRNLAHDLRPPSLDTVGLNLTLEGFCREFAQRTQLTIRYSGTDLPELPESVSTTFYRLLQEALTNVARHAQARRVQVMLNYDGETLSLQVTDDGQGFDTGSLGVSQQKGIGLLGMQERLELLNGWLEMDSQPGNGTRLSAHAIL